LIQQLNLSPSQIEYIYQNTDLALALFNYLSFDNLPTKKEIAIWAIEYFRFNPLTQLKEFENQFLGISEGYNSEYDELFWQDPNNIFAHQQLPSWIDFESAYPKNDKGENMKAEEVFNKIGGDVKDGRDRSLVDPNQTPWNNACALRISWALNKCDIKIPYIKGQTLKGGDGKYYFLGARNMNMWMRKTFGCSNPNRSLGEFYNPQAHHYDQSKVGKFGVGLEKELKDGKFNGIYTIVTNSRFASGHCDLLFSNATCLLSCHFADAAVYIEYCDIWNLK